MATRKTLDKTLAPFSPDMLSARILPPAARKTVAEIGRALDGLLFLDASGELSVDRKGLIALVNNPALVPVELKDIALLETVKHLGRRVKEVGNGLRVNWIEGMKHGLPLQTLSASGVSAAGLDKADSADALGKLLRKHVGDLPTEFTDTPPAELRVKLLAAFGKNRTVWDCLVANLGFWAALAIIGSLVVFLCLLPLGWQVALAIAAIYFGFVTAYFVLQCIVNPNYHA